MKRTLFILLFAVITSGLSAQIEFAPKSAVWHYGMNDRKQYYDGELYSTLKYDHDTTIKGKSWKVLKQLNYNQNKQAYSSRHYVIRQDSSIIRIWMDTFANVLYNFNMHVNDTFKYIDTAKTAIHAPFNIYKIILDSIGSVTISGHKRKVFYCEEAGFSISNFNPPVTYIEGIGRTDHFLPWEASFQEPDLLELRCYSDSALNYQVLSSPICDSIIDYTGIQTIFNDQEDNHWIVSPNPTKGYLSLAYHGNELKQGFASAEIFSTTGKKLFVFTMPAIQQNKQFDISAFPSGIYFIKITSQQSSEVIKIVKQ